MKPLTNNKLMQNINTNINRHAYRKTNEEIKLWIHHIPWYTSHFFYKVKLLHKNYHMKNLWHLHGHKSGGFPITQTTLKSKFIVWDIYWIWYCFGRENPILQQTAHQLERTIMGNPYVQSIGTCIYSQLSLSWLRLSRITAFLEEKIWSLL